MGIFRPVSSILKCSMLLLVNERHLRRICRKESNWWIARKKGTWKYLAALLQKIVHFHILVSMLVEGFMLF